MTRANRRAATAVAVLLIAVLCPAAVGSASDASGSPPPRRVERTEPRRGEEVDPTVLQASASRARTDAHGRRLVIVEGEAGRIADAVRSVGGEVTSGAPTMLEASVPAAQLQELGTAPGVTGVRAPSLFVPAEQSQGVMTTNAAAWHLGGSDGTGIEIAIVDLGFQSYASKLGTELPVTVETTSYCPGGGMGVGNHGTGVAEIVHDIAPGAALHLICIEDDADFYSAGQTILAQGIRIANLSGGFLNGRGDGSGSDTTPAGVVRTTRLGGVLWAIAAGNYGGTHYGFVSTDRDGDSSVEFDGGPASPQFFDDSELQHFVVAPGASATVFVRWDAWPTTTQDYDLAIWDFATSSQLPAATSTSAQWPSGRRPMEEATVFNSTGASRVYSVEVYRYQDGPGSFRASGIAQFDVFLSGDADFAPAGGRVGAAGSITEPASSPYAMAVGAGCYASGSLEIYSSQGPTTDGSIKPDITGPDGVSSSVYGTGSSCTGPTGFYGTSAAAPHVAGAAAVLLAANPGLDIAELQGILEERATDAGASGPDAAYGAGNLHLGDPATQPPNAPAGALFASLSTPVRIVETRSDVPSGCIGPRCGALGSGGSFTFDADALAEVPPNATAVVLNVTAVDTTHPGFVSLYPTGTARPTVSNLNFMPGQTLANHVTATLGADGGFTVYNHNGFTHVVIDLVGYYAPTASQGLTAVTPVRALETREDVPAGCLPAGVHCGPFTNGETLELPMRGVTFQGTTIPPSATAVVLNVTAVDPSKPGFVTVWPGGQSPPNASSLNFLPGTVVPNLVIAGIGANGSVDFLNFGGTTDLVVDVLGYFQPGGARYVALGPPTRALDTRSGTGLRQGSLVAWEQLIHQVGRLHGVPIDAAAALLNVTVAQPSGPGFLTVWPDGPTQPNASNLNFGAGALVSNSVLSAMGTAGRIRLYNHGTSAATPTVVDLSGYFVVP